MIFAWAIRGILFDRQCYLVSRKDRTLAAIYERVSVDVLYGSAAFAHQFAYRLLLHSPTHNSPTFPSVLRGMGRATASPSGFRCPPSHECGTPLATAGAARFARGIFRRTRTRLLRRLHEYSTIESRYCPFDVKAKVEQGPYDIIRVHSCRAQARIRARVERQTRRVDAAAMRGRAAKRLKPWRNTVAS